MKKAQAVLDVGPDTDEITLKKAYRLKALRVHPDKVGTHLKDWAHKETQELNWAFKYLKVHSC